MADAAKREVIEMIERMPEDASLDDIMYVLYVRARVDRGLREIAEGKLVSHEDVVRQMHEKWPESSGQ